MTGQAVERHQGADLEVSEEKWKHLQRMATVIAGSGVLGQGFKDNPNAVLAVELTLDQMGLPVTLPNMARFDFYENQVRPRVSLLIDFARLHGHSVWMPDNECDDDQAVCYGQRADEAQVHRVRVTKEQFAHLQQKTNWKNYAADMLKWRAASRLLRTVMGDTMLGLAPAAASALQGEAIAPIPPGVDPATGEILPVRDVPEDEDPDPPAADEPRPDPAAALRNEQGRVAERMWFVPTDKRPELAAAWRAAELPRQHELDAEQVKVALELVERFAVPPPGETGWDPTDVASPPTPAAEPSADDAGRPFE